MPAPTDVSNDEEGAIVNRRNAAQGNVNDWATTGLSFLSSFATIALGIGLAVVANEYNNVQKDHNKAVLQEQKRHNEVVEKKKQEEIALKEKEFESQTQAYFDSMIKDIIAAPYTPSTPKSYVARQQDEALGEALRENIEDTNHKFFMLVGESGSGKTTMMQNLLRKEYGKGGVLELSLSAETFVKLRAEGTPFVAQLEQSIWSLFKDCATHNKRERNLVKFVNHANEVWKKARGKDYAHPLIIYITLESKYDLDSDTMKDFSGTFSSLPTLLSSKTDSCKVIVEVSKTAISDKIEKDHPSDQTSLKVEAMTEDEFLRIGEQLLTMEDPQNLTAPYLKYYHDWLGGHTKALAQLVDQKAKFKFQSATADTKDEALEKLKEGIDNTYELACKDLNQLKQPNLDVLKGMAQAGAEGVLRRTANDDAIAELIERNSESTVIRRASSTNMRIHRYSHALYLHGVTGPNDTDAVEVIGKVTEDKNVNETIKEVKEKFGMNAKSA